MTQEFDAQRKVHVTRDAQGAARDLLHVEELYESRASTAVLAAREYLDTFGDRLGITPAELASFSLSPESDPTDAGVEYLEESGTSIYFRDPNGARLELICDPLGEMYCTTVL